MGARRRLRTKGPVTREVIDRHNRHQGLTWADVKVNRTKDEMVDVYAQRRQQNLGDE